MNAEQTQKAGAQFPRIKWISWCEAVPEKSVPCWNEREILQVRQCLDQVSDIVS